MHIYLKNRKKIKLTKRKSKWAYVIQPRRHPCLNRVYGQSLLSLHMLHHPKSKWIMATCVVFFHCFDLCIFSALFLFVDYVCTSWLKHHQIYNFLITNSYKFGQLNVLKDHCEGFGHLQEQKCFQNYNYVLQDTHFVLK